jgi:hypothetical protein
MERIALRIGKLAVLLLAALLALASLSSCGVGRDGQGVDAGKEGQGPGQEAGGEEPDSSGFTFLVCGDPDGLSPQFKQIVEAAKGASFLVIVGDLTPSGSEAELKKMYDYLQSSGVTYYAVRGDNDRARDPSGATFQKYFGPLWSSFDFQGSHFQLLDDSDGIRGFPADELAWMEEDLAATGARLKFAFAHIPPGAPPDLSTPWDAYAQARESGDEAIDIWQVGGVGTVFCGHLHAYTVYRAADPEILVTGGAGAPLHLPEALGGYYNYLQVHVSGGLVDVQVVRLQ